MCSEGCVWELEWDETSDEDSGQEYGQFNGLASGYEGRRNSTTTTMTAETIMGRELVLAAMSMMEQRRE